VDKDIFHELFVLEAANNHWGRVQRGLDIVQTYGALVRHHNLRAAIKFQFRDRGTFIHPEYLDREDIRYIKKTQATWLKPDEIDALISKVRDVGCIPMATPFDELSVALCNHYEFPIIKVASSDINDWPLLEEIAKLKKPVIVSTGGASLKDIDDASKFFENRNIPLAINHCVSLYPSEDNESELAQIAFLKKRFPKSVIGYSSHEQHTWEPSMHISYALGARTWERHIDIENKDEGVSPYCTLPAQANLWFNAFKKSKEMTGNSFTERRIVSLKEKNYLDQLVRGIYARKDISPGTEINVNNFSEYFFLAIPLSKGQLSCREVLNGTKIITNISANSPLLVSQTNSIYATDPSLRSEIELRGT
jgi:N-acetylneuraminate synthase